MLQGNFCISQRTHTVLGRTVFNCGDSLLLNVNGQSFVISKQLICAHINLHINTEYENIAYKVAKIKHTNVWIDKISITCQRSSTYFTVRISCGK